VRLGVVLSLIVMMRCRLTIQALEKGNTDIAKIHAANCIRKKTEGLNLLRLASRLDAVSSRLESAITMRQVTGSLGSVVKGMDKAMQSMNLEQVSSESRDQHI
jgi:charged multivesicular body protein 1